MIPFLDMTLYLGLIFVPSRFRALTKSRSKSTTGKSKLLGLLVSKFKRGGVN